MSLKKYAICVILFAFVSNAYSQKKVEILHANSLEYDESKGVRAKRLLGDVRLKQDDVLMFCDSAYFYSKENKVDAYGNVKITQGDSLKLTGDSLNYNGDTKFAKLRGDITLIQGGTTLLTNYLDYNIKEDVGYYWGGGKIINSKDNTTLTSTYGNYFPKTKFFYFKKDVTLISKDYEIKCDTLKFNTQNEITYFLGPTYITSDSSSIYCERGYYNPKKQISVFHKNAKIVSKSQEISGDSIYYDKNKGLGQIFCNAMIADTTEKLYLYGDYCWYNEKDSTSMMTDQAMLVQVFDEDTMFLHADTLLATLDSLTGQRELYAYYHVKFYKTDMQGKCDSLVFSDIDSTIKMLRNPILWSEDNQIIGDTIIIYRDGSKIKYMDIGSKSLIISQVDSSKYNQIQGTRMKGVFANNQLRKVHVNGNGKTIYYAEDDSTIIGVNKTVSENMVIYLDSSSVSKITFISQPTATLYPLKDISEKDTFLAGFVWYDNLRPKRKEDIFIWEEESTDKATKKPKQSQP